MRLAFLMLGACLLSGCLGVEPSPRPAPPPPSGAGAAPAAGAANPYANFPVSAIGAGNAVPELVRIDSNGMMMIRVTNGGPDVIQNPGAEVSFGIQNPRSMERLQSAPQGGTLAPGQSVEVVVGPIPAGAVGGRMMPLGSSPSMRDRRR